ncbi:unnamed protein product [Echinostoma caproni]|uniref:Uncharacterized protein n=1 Tax=Echinostoma caproni TaxID=27848 RepID=A0A183A1M3_9TREM|nr:unnamed protein product [Echinostoma caproni]
MFAKPSASGMKRPTLSQDEDLTMTSLTHAPATAATPNSPLVTLGSGTSMADISENPLEDLNLSRCTTPASLIHPDSVDLTEFLAAAAAAAADDTVPDGDETEINMDDLFLDSAALESSARKDAPSPNGRRKVKSEQNVLSFSVEQPSDLGSSVLPDVCAEEIVSSGVSKDSGAMNSLDTADLDQITLDPISDSPSIELDSLDHCNNIGDEVRRIRSPLTTPSLEINPSEREVFGLPWEDNLMNEVPMNEEEQNTSFNAGLLPPGRLKLLTKNSLRSIKSRLPPSRKDQQNTCIVGKLRRWSAMRLGYVLIGDYQFRLQKSHCRDTTWVNFTMNLIIIGRVHEIR